MEKSWEDYIWIQGTAKKNVEIGGFRIYLHIIPTINGY